MGHSGDVSSTPAVSDVVHDRVRDAARSFQMQNAVLVTRGGAEAIHDVRVALRRSRSYLRTFSRLFGPGLAVGISADLKWYATYLGRVRDIDVIAAALKAGADEHLDDAAWKEMEVVLEEHRDAAVSALKDCRAVGRYQTVLHHMSRLVDAPMRDRSDLDLRELLKRPWRDFRNASRRLDSAHDEQLLHQTRIRTKNLRYAAEIAQNFEPELAKRLITHATAIQDRIGTRRDAHAAAAWLERNKESTPLSSTLRAFFSASAAASDGRDMSDIENELQRVAKSCKRLRNALD